MNEILTAPFFDIVLHTRLAQGRNMWSDMLEMDLIYIVCEWL